MDVFKLAGTIACNNSDANRAIDETTDKAESAKGKFSQAFSKIGQGAIAVGKTIGTGLAVGAVAMTGLATKALGLGGELEQNLGGSEAVFKDFAVKMQDIGKGAFKDMGLSQSEFLATANKMGALFQGAGFGIEESADISSAAMQRAADVASIMGIDSATAMEAVAGAAKGNFTMMDNLGVAMNDTAIQNYALSKGIQTSTAEMTQQEKIGLAMEMFLDKTSYAAGNYAKENETLSGSLGTAKAALTNFLAGSGSVDDLVESFSSAASVITDNLTDMLPRLVTGVTEIINKLVPEIPGILQALLPGVVSGAVMLLQGLVNALPAIIDVIMGALPTLITGVQNILESIINALPSIITSLVNALPTLLPQLINGLISVIILLMKKLPEMLDPIIDKLPDIIISVVNALMDNLPALIKGCIQLIIGIVKAIPKIMLALINAMPVIFSSIVDGMMQALPQLITGIVQILGEVGKAMWAYYSTLFTMVWDGIKAIFAPVGEFFSSVWNGIVFIFSVVVDWFKSLFEKVSEVIHKIIDPWIEIFGKVWEGVKNAFEPVVEFFGDVFGRAWDKIKEVFAPVTNFFSDIWNGIKSAFGSVTDWFKDVFSKAWQAVKDVFSIGGKIFDGIKDGIVDVFKTVVNGIIKGINKILKVPFDELNKVLANIKDVEILGVKPFDWVSTFNVPQIPTLATGGVLRKGQTGYLEGDGDEAVVPLEKNTGWIKNLATQINKVKAQSASNTANNMVPTDQLTFAIKNEIGKRLDNVEMLLENVIKLLKEYFPELLNSFDVTLVMDDGTVAAKLTPKIDKNLGKIYKRKGRGN